MTYAITGFVLFWCRRWPAKVFWIIGSVLIATFVIPILIGAILCHFIDFSEFRDSWDGIAESIRTEEKKESAAMTGSWA